MKNIKLVAVDIDGTLLTSKSRLLDENVEAIIEAQKAGIKVILATGKTRDSTLHIIDRCALTLPGVFTQGLIIQNGDGSILHETRLDSKITDGIFSYLDQQNLPYVVFTREGGFIPQSDAYYDNVNAKYDEPEPQVIGPMAGRAAELGVNKILVGDKKDIQARRKDLESRFGQSVTILQAVPEYLEILPQGVSKGAGLKWLLDYLGIDPAAVMAIGDGENDIQMLQLAGIGVAMGNAHSEVKQVADEVVGTNDEAGVAEALRRFVLHQVPSNSGIEI